jgi:crotonobetainyl-CoA:carnitine CoA-transferase CaiB-like acyl-CoA transferase
MAGPRATGLLADYGADVLWVEPPGGDPWRDELAVPYATFNRGKRSLELDLRSAAGRAELERRLESADLFVESWRPGVAADLGLDHPSLHERFPRLVTLSISAFGSSGRWRDLRGYEAFVHALVGTMGEQVGHRPAPIYEGLPFASIGAGYLGLIGALAALYRRITDGLGRHVETSLFDGALAYLSMMWSDNDIGTPMHRVGTTRVVSGSFLCADDEYLGVHTGAVGAFKRLMEVLGLDERMPSSPTGMDIGAPLTPEQIEILKVEVPALFGARSRSEWLDVLRGADVCAVPHLHPCGAFDEPQTLHNRMTVWVDDPVLGRTQQVAPPIRFGDDGPGSPAGAPRVREGGAGEWSSSVAPRSAAEAPVTDRPLLDGVRILDLGAYFAGPFSSRLLADLGADVIKLEPIAGDQLRGMNRPFRAAQAGKRSIAANLKDPELADGLRALIGWADIVHHNLRPGAAERLGVGYDDVHAVNPRAVYVYAPGWGSSGPDMTRQSFAPMLAGFCGVGFEVAGQYNAPLFPLGNEDPGNGLVGAVGMLIGLLSRARTGSGMYVENPQLNAMLAHMSHVLRLEDGTVLGAELLDPLQYGIGALDRLYETSDGWIVLVAKTPSEVHAVEQALGITAVADRFEMESLVGDALYADTTEAWVSRLTAAGVPHVVPIATNNCFAVMRDPEQHAIGRVGEVPHPTEGRIREPAHLVRVSDCAVAPHRLAPNLGEHTVAILRSVGYSDERIHSLLDRGSALQA